MTITAPPRPAGPSDPVDREDPEALIEEARRRARNRRRIYGALAGLAALVGVAVFTVIERADSSQSGSPPLGTQVNLSAGIANSKIVFLRDPDGDGRFCQDVELWVMNPDGSGQRRLKRKPDCLAPVWSPDARRIAFVGRRAGAPLPGGGRAINRDIYVMNADGSGERRLTTGPGVELWPAWSPDGRRIAFTGSSRPTNGLFTRDIYVMNTDGSGQRRLTRDSVLRHFPAWSPDGRKIAFAGTSGGSRAERKSHIYVINADGSGQRQLAQTPPGWVGPAWSPDGRKIAFTGAARPYGIYVMNADGSDQRMLAPGLLPVWSPDGRKIAFLRRIRAYVTNAYVMNADGTGQRRLGDSVSDVSDDAPSWSPDGRQVLFARFSGEPFEIFVANVDGSASRNLTRNPGHDGSAVWSAGQQK